MVVPLTTLGVPLICPVVELKIKPVGRDGLILKLRGVNPPVAVTGAKAVTALPCVIDGILFDTVVTITGGEFTVRLKVLLVVC